VGAILSAITGLCCRAPGLALGQHGRSRRYHREREATDTLAVVHIERTILSSKQAIRIELSGLGNLFDAHRRAPAPGRWNTSSPCMRT